MKTSDLTGAALDWAVAKCEGETLSQSSLAFQIQEHGCLQRTHLGSWKPSISWAQGGPIIEREKITVGYERYGAQGGETWDAVKKAFDDTVLWLEYAPTPLIAAMRCYVCSVMGEIAEIPEELE